MIQPTPGRIVWFYPDVNDGRTKGPDGPNPLAAMVAKVVHERCVNLTVSKEDGTTFGAQNIVLLQDGFALSDPDRAYAEWMPFQKGQAAKTELLQAATAAGVAPMPALALTSDLFPLHEKIDALGAKVDQALATVAPQLEPFHAAITELTAKADAALAAPAAAVAEAIEPVHAKIAGVEQATQSKFEELGDWLKKMFTDFEQKLAAVSSHPALEIPPIAPAANPAA